MQNSFRWRRHFFQLVFAFQKSTLFSNANPFRDRVFNFEARGLLGHSMTPLQKFEEWFEKPLKEIESLKDCNAAFLAFMVSFGLFERLIKSDLKLRGIDGTPENFRAEAARVLRLEQDLFDKFWGMYRDGIQHYLQPKKFCSKGINYDWQISDSFGALPEWFNPENPAEKVKIIRINPWKWSKHILCLWHSRLDLLEILDSFRLGDVFEE